MNTITVLGAVGPQGSKRSVGNGRMIESSEKVRPWRDSVAWEARAANVKVDGPVSVELIFTMRKPKSAPKRRRTWPDRKPDIDKCCRSTLDALVTAGAIEDDARVVELKALKVFPGEHDDALDVPGVLIRIISVEATA